MLFSDTVVPYWPYYSAILWYRRRYRIGHIIQRYCGTEDCTGHIRGREDSTGHVIQRYCGTEDSTVLAILFNNIDTEDSTVLTILFNNTVVQKTVPYWLYCLTILWCRRQYRIGYIVQQYCGAVDSTVLAILFNNTVVQ